MNTTSLCKPGLKCCVSSDAYGDNPPPELVYPNKTKSNFTKVETRTTPKSTTSSTTQGTTPHMVKLNAPTTSRPQIMKECSGDCVSGLFALFCDGVDSEATCPNDGSCCISNSVSQFELKTG